MSQNQNQVQNNQVQNNQAQSQNQEKVTEQKQKVEAKASVEAEDRLKKEEEKRQLAKAAEMHQPNYERYAELRFIQLDGGKLKENILKELEVLKEALSKCKGPKGKKNRTAHIGMKTIRIVEDLALPPSYVKLIKEKDLLDYYCK